jgi:hypothetical protein
MDFGRGAFMAAVQATIEVVAVAKITTWTTVTRTAARKPKLLWVFMIFLLSNRVADSVSSEPAEAEKVAARGRLVPVAASVRGRSGHSERNP